MCFLLLLDGFEGKENQKNILPFGIFTFHTLECTFPEENVKWCLQWQISPPGC